MTLSPHLSPTHLPSRHFDPSLHPHQLTIDLVGHLKGIKENRTVHNSRERERERRNRREREEIGGRGKKLKEKWEWRIEYCVY